MPAEMDKKNSRRRQEQQQKRGSEFNKSSSRKEPVPGGMQQHDAEMQGHGGYCWGHRVLPGARTDPLRRARPTSPLTRPGCRTRWGAPPAKGFMRTTTVRLLGWIIGTKCRRDYNKSFVKHCLNVLDVSIAH